MSGVVIDANLAIALMIPLPYSESSTARIQAWQQAGIPILVPGLWGYEVVSALRKAAAGEWITLQEAENALNELWALGFEQVPATLELHRSSLKWADRIGQKVAYDSAYLALAETNELEFWTADRPLAESAKAAGAKLVHYLGDEEL